MTEVSIIGKSIEFIYCGCGCGRSRSKYKIEKGYIQCKTKPERFIKGHNMLGTKQSESHRKHNAEARLGKKLSEEHCENIRLATTGKNNPMYGKHHSVEAKQKIGKANSKEIVAYSRLHFYIRRLLPRPELCPICEERKSYEVACTTYIYNKDLKNWNWLCQSCHKKYDYISKAIK